MTNDNTGLQISNKQKNGGDKSFSFFRLLKIYVDAALSDGGSFHLYTSLMVKKLCLITPYFTYFPPLSWYVCPEYLVGKYPIFVSE